MEFKNENFESDLKIVKNRESTKPRIANQTSKKWAC